MSIRRVHCTGYGRIDSGRRGSCLAEVTRIRASSAMTPRSSASSGLTSISRISGCAMISELRCTSASAIASRSAGGRSRYPSRRRWMRVCRINSRASFKSTGSNARRVSRRTSTAVPPAPNMIMGPNVASSVMPMINSWAREPLDHRLHGEARNAGVGPFAPHTRQHLARGTFGCLRRADVQLDTADIGLV